MPDAPFGNWNPEIVNAARRLRRPDDLIPLPEDIPQDPELREEFKARTVKAIRERRQRLLEAMGDVCGPEMNLETTWLFATTLARKLIAQGIDPTDPKAQVLVADSVATLLMTLGPQLMNRLTTGRFDLQGTRAEVLF